ncbi:MAG: arylesterase [Pseudomonadota bacterium]
MPCIKTKQVYLVALCCFALAACGKAPSLTPLTQDAVVLAFGDSLTYGTGTTRKQSYPAVLSQLIKRKVINAGVPGEISANGLQRLPELFEQHSPQLLILCHGGNDFLQKLGDAEAAENIRQMIRLAQSRGIGVVLVGVPKPGIFVSTASFYEDIAEEFNIPYEGEILGDILSNNDMKSDPVHPNAAGYQEFAKALAILLQSAGGVSI